MEAAQEQEEHESPAAEEAPAASPAKPAEAAAGGAGAQLPRHSPGSSSKAPRGGETLAAADAVAAAAAAAAAAPTLPFDSERQLDVSQLLAKMPAPEAPAPEPLVGAGGRACSQPGRLAQLQSMHTAAPNTCVLNC